MLTMTVRERLSASSEMGERLCRDVVVASLIRAAPTIAMIPLADLRRPRQPFPLLPNRLIPLLPIRRLPLLPNRLIPPLPIRRLPLLLIRRLPLLPIPHLPLFPIRRLPLLPMPLLPLLPMPRLPLLERLSQGEKQSTLALKLKQRQLCSPQ
jgi:hypothetical protein